MYTLSDISPPLTHGSPLLDLYYIRQR